MPRSLRPSVHFLERVEKNVADRGQLVELHVSVRGLLLHQPMLEKDLYVIVYRRPVQTEVVRELKPVLRSEQRLQDRRPRFASLHLQQEAEETLVQPPPRPVRFRSSSPDPCSDHRSPAYRYQREGMRLERHERHVLRGRRRNLEWLRGVRIARGRAGNMDSEQEQAQKEGIQDCEGEERKE